MIHVYNLIPRLTFKEYSASQYGEKVFQSTISGLDSSPAIMIVLAFPPKLSLSSHVKTELRYGMNNFFLGSLLMEFSLASATTKSKNIIKLHRISDLPHS